MNRSGAILAALWCVMLTPVESRAQSNCTRADLQSAVDSYLAAQGKGTPSAMRLATAVKYSENMQDAPIDKGVLRDRQGRLAVQRGQLPEILAP